MCFALHKAELCGIMQHSIPIRPGLVLHCLAAARFGGLHGGSAGQCGMAYASQQSREESTYEH
jgi:hypothetical protein